MALEAPGGFHDDKMHDRSRRRVHIRFDGWLCDRRRASNPTIRTLNT